MGLSLTGTQGECVCAEGGLREVVTFFREGCSQAKGVQHRGVGRKIHTSSSKNVYSSSLPRIPGWCHPLAKSARRQKTSVSVPAVHPSWPQHRMGRRSMESGPRGTMRNIQKTSYLLPLSFLTIFCLGNWYPQRKDT